MKRNKNAIDFLVKMKVYKVAPKKTNKRLKGNPENLPLVHKKVKRIKSQSILFSGDKTEYTYPKECIPTKQTFRAMHLSK